MSADTRTKIPKNIKNDGLNKSAKDAILLQKDYIN
jgi:hypothetical protein